MAKTFPAMIKNEFLDLREKAGLSCSDISSKYNISLRTVYRWNKNELVSSPGYSLVLKDLKEIAKKASVVKRPADPAFTFIDLFAGIGGFRKAFDSIGGKCVFTSEWDKNSRATYQANFESDHMVVGDIREFTKDAESLSQIPKHDVLVAGFPCQPFSIAGVSKKNSLGKYHGFKCDTQGTLFFDLAQIIEYHRPAAFLLENVKNLKSHNGGNTFEVIRHTLEKELQYDISFRILDGRHWVPQHRERVFIVGFRKDLNIPFDFGKLSVPEIAPRLHSILHSGSDVEDDPQYLEDGRVPDKYTLSEHLWNYLQRYKEKHAAKGNGFGFGLFGPEDVARTLSARYYKDGSEILIKQEEQRPRRLTPRECSRLMGFDGPLESNFKIPVSDTQAYRQFGNSVVVPCATAVANLMKPFIIESIQRNKKQLVLPFEGKGYDLKAAYA
jgi:DNA (cytosine-5)-methyltransferase 1